MATNGADVIAYKDNIKYVIQVKFYNNPVGNKAVQEVVGAIGMYKANKGIVVTNSTFTDSAIELASANNIELINGEKIEKYKKEIIDNIEPTIINYDGKFIKNVIELWKTSITDISNNDILELCLRFGTVLKFVDSENFYKDNNINKFLELLYQYSYLDEKLNSIMNMGYNDIIESGIKAGIFKAFLIRELDNYSNMDSSNTTNDDKLMNIYINNVNEIGTKEQLLALSILFNWDTEETINNVLKYKEKIAD